MFTGIVEELGSVVAWDGTTLRVAASAVLGDVVQGASIAVNGCCLTVIDWHDPTDSSAGWWEAEVSPETYRRTSLGSLEPGDAVNLERPLRVGDRMGGHLVQGHVDAVGVVRVPAPELAVDLPEHLGRYVVEKGSITVDGVSLTVVAVGQRTFSAAVILHTSEVTTLGRRGIGDQVNIEVDVMAKYTEKLVAAYLGDPGSGAVSSLGSGEEDPHVA